MAWAMDRRTPYLASQYHPSIIKRAPSTRDVGGARPPWGGKIVGRTTRGSGAIGRGERVVWIHPWVSGCTAMTEPIETGPTWTGAFLDVDNHKLLFNYERDSEVMVFTEHDMFERDDHERSVATFIRSRVSCFLQPPKYY